MIEIIIALSVLIPLGVITAYLIHLKKDQKRFQQTLLQVWLPQILDEVEKMILYTRTKKKKDMSNLVELCYQRIGRIFDARTHMERIFEKARNTRQH